VKAQPPVVVVPGITGTELVDHYPLEPEIVWSTFRRKQFERLALHPDDLRYEAREPAQVRARSAFTIVYGDLVEALRHDLTRRADKPTPVFCFGYDWRQDCARTAEQLGEFVAEVAARTALLPHYREDRAGMQVDLVGHSMGGLIIAALLGGARRAPAVRRVVTLGTPFRGSIDSILKLAIGMGSLTGDHPRDREREAARVTPALYQLLPSYAGAIDAAPSLPSDIFEIDAWQPSLLQTLREYVRLEKAEIRAEDLLRGFLAGGKQLISSVNSLPIAAALPEGADGWLPIVGIGEETHCSAQIKPWRGAPWFEFAPPVNEPPPSLRTGDGTVPLAGAVPDFLDLARLVCVSREDLSFWELKDRVLLAVQGLHAFLPVINFVQHLTIRFLRSDFRSDDVRARRAPGVAVPTWPSWLRPAN
jgi:pimeloyl-ACP methyl ester carboxylesterase